MKLSHGIKVGGALGLIALAVACYLRLSPEAEGSGARTYFYDLQEKRLFTLPSGVIPPVQGLRGTQSEAVRAVVVSITGDPADRKHQQIAYLEKYTPEQKQLFEEVRRARTEGRSEEGRIDRKQIPANTLVRRLNDAEWHALNSPEGARIANEWQAPGPDGRVPVVCSP